MVKLYKDIENQPVFLVLNEIEVAQENSGISKPVLQKISDNLKTFGCNFSLPIVCITDEEDKYHLLTGLPIYEAAVLAGIDRIWVFLIAAQKPEAEKYIEQALLQSKLNDRVIEPQDITDFLEFINNKKSDLTTIDGIGHKYEKQIKDVLIKGDFSSLEDMQNRISPKRPLSWLKAYKQKNS